MLSKQWMIGLMDRRTDRKPESRSDILFGAIHVLERILPVKKRRVFSRKEAVD